MRIKHIKFQSHPRLGSLELSFINESGKAASTVIFAGENGSGKTSILEEIAELANIRPSSTPEARKISVTFELNQNSSNAIVDKANNFRDNNNKILAPAIELNYTIDYSRANTWDKYNISLLLDNDQIIDLHSYLLTDEKGRDEFIKIAFSPVEINFQHNAIQSITTKDIDNPQKAYLKATSALPTEVAQLLVDIQSLDDATIGEWVRQNPQQTPPSDLIDLRTNRFRRSFAKMFPSKSYKGVRNGPTAKEVIFSDSGREITLNQLSSGEKQIVFRGSFLLSNQKNLSGGIVIVDEPEISLHPNWQSKIIEYYRSMFADEHGEQQCQLFFATHSPFIVHSIVDEHVIILKKDIDGSIKQVENASFPSVGPNKIVEKAFDFSYAIPRIEKPLVVFVEGDTDKRIIERAWDKLFGDVSPRFELVTAYAASQIRTILARGDLFAHSPQKKFVGLFDFDSAYTDWKSINWPIISNDSSQGLTKCHSSGAGLALLLPVPSSRSMYASERLGAASTLSIEFLFEDTDIPSHFLDEKPVPQSSAFLKVFKDGKKTEFSNWIASLPVESFKNFRILLTTINSIGQ